MQSSGRLTRSSAILAKLRELNVDFPVSAEHRKVLNSIGSDFTFAAPVKGAWSTKPIWLALLRLPPELEERFSIHQEIPVIYSAYDDLQGRTISRIPDILETLPRDRRGITSRAVFIWTPDRQLVAKLETYSKTERLLLSLPAGSADTFLSGLMSRLYSQDLYSERTAVTGDQFFGRQSILAQLRGDVGNGRVAAIFGTRKTGKTSILKELARTSEASDADLLREVYVYCDLEHLPRPESGYDPVPELLGDLSEAIRREFKRRDLRTKEFGDLPEQPSLRQFRRALTDALEHPSNSDVHLVLILDEVEHLCPPDAHAMASSENTECIPQFLGVLRKVSQELDNFNFVLAGLASAIVESGELYGRHNPLFNIANAYYLAPFTVRETAQLLRGIGARLGMNWSKSAIDLVHDETGGQVVLVRELASQVWRSTRMSSTALIDIDELHVESEILTYRRLVRAQITETIKHVKRYYPQAYELCGELFTSPTQFPALANAFPIEVNRLINLGLIKEEDNIFYPTRILGLGWDDNVSKPAPQSMKLPDLIIAGEGRCIEFKSSVRRPTNNEAGENVVFESLVKGLLGFMNSDGGTLIAGIADNGEAVGLDADIKASNHSKDRLLRWVVDKLNSYLGEAVTTQVSVAYDQHAGAEVLVFTVAASMTPVFQLKPILGKRDLLVRQGANTIPLQGAGQHEYIAAHFREK